MDDKQSKHTPTPWWFDDWRGRINGPAREATGNYPTVCFVAGGEGDPLALTNAHLIVAAVNNHERLLGLCKQAYRALDASRETLGVLEDHGGHDGLMGKGLLATCDQNDDARAALRVMLEELAP